MVSDDDRWSYSAGAYGYTVRVFAPENGNLRISYRHPATGERIRRSLGHKDRDKAEAQADDAARDLKRKGATRYEQKPPTVARLLSRYRKHRSPDKAPAVQREDDRQAEMWTRVLGPGFDLSKVSRREWDSFKRRRSSGAIDPRGKPVRDEEERCPVGPRTVARDLVWLRAVCRWATEWRDAEGHLLMERDPTRGLGDVPEEKNPTRPVATTQRLERLRKHYQKVRMRVTWNGRREYRESHLPEILDLVAETGRRVGAVCALRYEDLVLERTRSEPYGAIVWPEDTDKMGKRWRCPLNPRAREAVERALLKRPAAGPGPLFPAPMDRKKPVRSDQVGRWLRKAEEAAELEPLEGGRFHPYRRMWACLRKALPDVDVAQAGGWASLEALKLAYQRPDADTMLAVVQHEAELREVR